MYINKVFGHILLLCQRLDTTIIVEAHKHVKCLLRRHFHSKKVQVGKDQEKAQSEKDSHSKNRGGKKPN